MSDAQLDDLKQFITATISQQIAAMDLKFDELRQEMHDGFASIGAIVDNHNDQLDNHETRLTKLEKSPA